MRRGWVRVRADLLERGTGPADVHHAVWDATGDLPTAETAVVLVHGLGGSHLNWRRFGPLVARHGPVWAPDLAGFGLTPLAGRTASLGANLDLLAGYVATVAEDGPALVVGNSMGGLLGVLLAARHPHLVSGLVLVDVPLPPVVTLAREPLVTAHFAVAQVPFVGERLLARARAVPVERQVRDTMRLVGVDPATLGPELLAEDLAMARRRRDLPEADTALLQATRSLVRRLTVGRRAVMRAVRAVDVPVLAVHGGRDRLVPVAAARRAAVARPDWAVRVYEEEGHCPMVSASVRLAADVDSWLSGRRRHDALAS